MVVKFIDRGKIQEAATVFEGGACHPCTGEGQLEIFKHGVFFPSRNILIQVVKE